MNERIKQLMIKSGAYDHYEVNEGVNGDEKPMVRFAEMIIQECIEVASKARSLEASAMITMHFGIGRQGWVCPTCGVDRAKDVCPKGHSAALLGSCPMIGEAQ